MKTTTQPFYRSLSLAAFFLAALFAGPAKADAKDAEQQLVDRYMKSVAVLSSETMSGGSAMHCTLTAFEREGDLYRFVTAAHCVAEDDELKERVQVERTNFLIVFEDENKKTEVRVSRVYAGYQHRGDDFAVLEVKLEGMEIPIMPLADKPAAVGEQVINIASPGGYGKQFFKGHVSLEKIARPIIIGDINWQGAMMLSMPVDGGSSGSSVVSVEKKAIVAFVVGIVYGAGSLNTIVIPVEKFKKFWTDVKAKKYRWYRDPEEADSDDEDGGRGKGKGGKHPHFLPENEKTLDLERSRPDQPMRLLPRE